MGEEGAPGAAGRVSGLAFVWFPQNPGQRGGSDRKGQARLHLPGWPGARSGRGPERRGRCSEAASCAARAGEGAEAKAGSPGCASPPADRSPGEGAPQATLNTWGWSGGGCPSQDLGPNEDGGRGSFGGGWRLVGPTLAAWPADYALSTPTPPNSTSCLWNWALGISTTYSDLGATSSFPVERPQHPGSRPHPHAR